MVPSCSLNESFTGTVYNVFNTTQFRSSQSLLGLRKVNVVILIYAWHQLNLIMTVRATVNNLFVALIYNGADCNTAGQSLVCSKVRLRPNKLHHLEQK